MLNETEKQKEIQAALRHDMPETAEAWKRELNLLPCPFCGGEAKLDHLTAVDDFFICCTKCEIQQIANYNDYEAIERWNTRARQAPKDKVPFDRGVE
jgi:Lar family restriction alleviation protein